jgi:hypothetical protein
MRRNRKKKKKKTQNCASWRYHQLAVYGPCPKLLLLINLDRPGTKDDIPTAKQKRTREKKN